MFKAALFALIATATATKKIKGPLAKITHKTWMDIRFGDEPKGRITFGLYGDEVPKTVENFRQLCTGEHEPPLYEKIPGLVRKAHYKDLGFHQIIHGFGAESGDIQSGNGLGGLSIYSKPNKPYFEDENFNIKHSKKHLLTM